MSFFQNYSMKTVLLTYSAIFSALFSSLSFLTGYFGGRVIINEFLAQSNIIYERDNANKISYASHYQKYLNSYFQINANPLITLNQLYLAYFTKINQNSSLNQNNFGGLESYPQIIANKNNSKFSDSVFCYTFKEKFNDAERDQIQQVNFGDFIGSIGQIIHPHFDTNEAFLYGYIVEQPRLLYSYPCYSLGQEIQQYQPETRPWYLLAQNISEQIINKREYFYSISDPYLFNQDQKVGITITLPLIDKSFQFKGAWGLDIFSDYIIQKTQKMLQDFKDIYIMILTKDGILVNQQGHEHAYFYDQNITGFNKNDWDEIRKNSQQYYKLMNQKTNSQQSIIKFYLPKQQLYFLLQSITLIQISIIDNASYQDYLDECKTILQTKIDEKLHQAIILLLSVYFSLLICSYLMISKLIISPLQEIIQCVKVKRTKTLREKYEDLLKWRFQIKRKLYISPALKNLQNAVYFLNNFHFQNTKQKNSSCQLMQKFQFPKKEWSKRGVQHMLQKNSKAIRIQDFNTQIDDFSLNRNQQNSNNRNKLRFIHQFNLNSKDKQQNQIQNKDDLNFNLSNQIQLIALSFVKSQLTTKSEVFNDLN
ncbi:unnamed protein product (macronuclear) [Paramecium tetraurelia]|uniref:Cache domain-containing protein n=1 Tax=Paramecium tetraurelia TaxID=5888 RepID=A0DH47_PARTE|nr:uncharacterized protein GSPATT00016750001 [Paramecium tetraurelia]CAK82364.1 unnamed protein product [Paramecium tetraurelia]|eukprot:XP_001449761.1 hypothetical protein (macronuclear) [Paramecium tetraurelia strain d4-2]